MPHSLLKDDRPHHAPGPEDHHKSGVPKNSAFRKISERAQSHAHEATGKLAADHLTVDGWQEEIEQILLKGHTDAWVLGRKRAGDLSDVSADDRTMGLEARDTDAEFLDGFCADIEDGRYLLEDGTLDIEAINNRLNLYVGKMRGTANEAFVEASEADDEFIWELRGGEKHCEDCPQYAEMSPWTKDTLGAYPGSGQSACLGNCTCVLIRVRGDERVEGFERVDLYDE